VPVVLAAALLSGCGGGSSASDATTTDADEAPSVLTSPAQKVTFAQVQAAIHDLYRAHPGLLSFTVQDVSYNETTRDKVLDVCHRGGAEKDAASLESVRLAGCAPLIFFFWQYGKQSSAPDSIDVARKLYWYAVRNVHGPFDSKDSLSGLLQSWGIP
jgi:hypothetical protein